MLPSWLTQRGAESSSEESHAVLGTPLRAPLMSDQEEAFSPAVASGVPKKASGNCLESYQQQSATQEDMLPIPATETSVLAEQATPKLCGLSGVHRPSTSAIC